MKSKENREDPDPSVVSRFGSGSVFFHDGWIRNSAEEFAKCLLYSFRLAFSGGITEGCAKYC